METPAFSYLVGAIGMPGKMEPIPGTDDIWFPETNQWSNVENTARETFALYGYGELRTPIFERTDVFVRGIGDQTEVVQKEMYTFEDRGGRSLTLRPEGTAGIMRAIANQGLSEGTEKRVFYLGPMFRGERPAAGRKRQFHQIGTEAVGRVNPAIDAECIAMLVDFLERIGLRDNQVLVNSRGTREDRDAVTTCLRDYFTPLLSSMCEDCRRRIGTNVWRILDCKAEECQQSILGAPAIVDVLGDANREYFENVCSFLEAQSVSFEYAPRLVRGLDYYEHTVFEVISDRPGLGAQNAIAGGGRYSVPLAGFKNPLRGVGFAVGVERLLLAKGVGDTDPADVGPVDVYVAALGPECLAHGLALAGQLRAAGLRALAETDGRSLKAQLRTANRVDAPLAIIVGGSEIERDIVLIRNMADSQQHEVARPNAVEAVLAALENL